MSSGAPRASGRVSANGHGDERPRVSATHGTNLKNDRSESSKGPSPRPGSLPGIHKRTASGNPRTMTSRNVEERERRYEERRVTERTFEAHIERAVPRTTSPERSHRRGVQSESRAASNAPRHKTPEARSRAETPQGMVMA